eukprot:5352822-Alexandrium_andersonii.AAC.1
MKALHSLAHDGSVCARPRGLTNKGLQIKPSHTTRCQVSRSGAACAGRFTRCNKASSGLGCPARHEDARGGA